MARSETDLLLNQFIPDSSFFAHPVKTSISVSCFYFTYKALYVIEADTDRGRVS
jgi:hypothetical protein